MLTESNVLTKYIKSEEDLNGFLESETYDNIMTFIISLGESVKGHAFYEGIKKSEKIIALENLLIELKELVNKNPPGNVGGRFGSPVYRIWFDEMSKLISTTLHTILEKETEEKNIKEIIIYLKNSFGNKERIDFGTGHELNFLLFLYTLFSINYFTTEEDKFQCILILFRTYITLARTIQQTYSLEPAGSKGVWGLDDYFFLLFIFGSYQLLLQDEIKVSDTMKHNIISLYSNQYLYLNGIKNIMDNKKNAPLYECAPILYDISHVLHWKKVCHGLLKMFHGEVMSKFPVMQHFLFGSIIQFDNSKKHSNISNQIWNQGAKGMGTSYAHPSIINSNLSCG